MTMEEALQAPDERLLDDSITAATFIGSEISEPPPTRARIVVIGGGVVGASTAAHLAEFGEKDVLLLERDRIACGTSWHAAGLLARIRGSHPMTEMASYGVEVYAGLGERTGLPVAFNRNGSLTLARTQGRVDELKSMAVMCRHHGIEAHHLPPEEIAGLHPLISSEGVLAAFHQPTDAMINPGWGAAAMAKWAYSAGVTVREGVPVTGLRVSGTSTGDRRVSGVTTSRGDVEADIVVLCAGLWTRDLAGSVGVAVPLYAAEHVYVTTGPVPGAVPSLPLTRDLDSFLYVRHHRGCLVVGAFEPNGKPRATNTIPADFAFGEFEPDWEHFRPARENAERVIPILKETPFERFLCAPESFTPDVNFCLGEAPEVAGLFVGAGFNSQGIIYAPGAGRALADWVVNGAPGFDASAVDLARFDQVQANPAYLHERTRESLGRLYAMHWPGWQSEAARDLRLTPLTERLRGLGACLGETNGWERPLWFARSGEEPVPRYSYRKPGWFNEAAGEHQAAREAVAFFDLSTFAKFEVSGPDSLEVMQKVFTADVDLPIGRLAYTLALNSRGGIDLDGTVARLGIDRFRFIAPTVARRKALAILERAAAGTSASVFDATESLAVLHIAGPKTGELLQRLTPDDVSDSALSRFSFREMELGRTLGLVMRLSFTGELGYEFYVPNGAALGLFETLLREGDDLGLRLAGLDAYDSLRAEVGYRHLGHDIGPSDDPIAAGLERFVAFDKPGGFIGRDALLSEPRARRQAFFLVTDPEAIVHHGESVLTDGKIAGYVTSAAYGHSLGGACGLVVLDPEIVASLATADGAAIDTTVNFLGDEIPAQLSLNPFRRASG